MTFMDLDLRKRPESRLLCAEPLEGRRLLSAAAYAAALSPSPTADGGDADVVVAPADLPAQVVAALRARFPGAQPAASDLTVSGEQLVYDVTAHLGGRTVDVRLTPAGGPVDSEPQSEPPPDRAVAVLEFDVATAADDPGDVRL